MTPRIARLASAAWLCLAASTSAQDRPLVDDPELSVDLSRHHASSISISVGQSLPFDALTCAFIREAVVDGAFLGDDGSPVLLLVSFRTTWSGGRLFPNIVHRNGDGTWMRTIVPATQDGFSHFAKSNDGQHWIILMDNVPESAGWDTRTVISRDGGRSWRYGESLRKVHYYDRIRYLRIVDGGIATAVEHFTDGVLAPNDQVGYHLFETADWGETWSERRYLRVFDMSGYVDAYPIIVAMRESRERLSDVGLEGFESCTTP